MNGVKIKSSYYYSSFSKTVNMSSEDLNEKYIEHKAPTRKTSESPLIKKNKTDTINYCLIDNANTNLGMGRASLSTSELKEFVPLENNDKICRDLSNLGINNSEKNGSNILNNQNLVIEENLCKRCHVPEGFTIKKAIPHQIRKQSSFLIQLNNKDELKKSASPESTIFNKYNLDEVIEKDGKFEEFLNFSLKNNTINYCNHVYETLESMKILKELNPSLKEEYKKKIINLPPCKKEMTIIFDLDETLIHLPRREDEEEGEVNLQFTLTNGNKYVAGINVRPFAKECLKELSQFGEIMIFTAGLQHYAEVIVNYLDPKREYISYVFTREYCIYDEENNLYIKDLRIIPRDIAKTIIIDNSIPSFGYQLNNGIPALPFYKNKDDWFLKRIIGYINILRNEPDVRELNKKEFELQAIYELEISKYLNHYSKSSEEKTDQHSAQISKEVNKCSHQNVQPKRSSYYCSIQENTNERKANKLLLPDYPPDLSKEGKEFLDTILERYSPNRENPNE